jgi:hypothetical protein
MVYRLSLRVKQVVLDDLYIAICPKQFVCFLLILQASTSLHLGGAQRNALQSKLCMRRRPPYPDAGQDFVALLGQLPHHALPRVAGRAGDKNLHSSLHLTICQYTADHCRAFVPSILTVAPLDTVEASTETGLTKGASAAAAAMWIRTLRRAVPAVSASSAPS